MRYYLPLTFAILSILAFISLGVLSILGLSPFYKRSEQIGGLLIGIGLFGGFYPGLLLGNGIIWVFDKINRTSINNESIV